MMLLLVRRTSAGEQRPLGVRKRAKRSGEDAALTAFCPCPRRSPPGHAPVHSEHVEFPLAEQLRPRSAAPHGTLRILRRSVERSRARVPVRGYTEAAAGKQASVTVGGCSVLTALAAIVCVSAPWTTLAPRCSPLRSARSIPVPIATRLAPFEHSSSWGWHSRRSHSWHRGSGTIRTTTSSIDSSPFRCRCSEVSEWNARARMRRIERKGTSRSASSCHLTISRPLAFRCPLLRHLRSDRLGVVD